MNAATNLVILASDSLWPAIQSVVHWHRHAGGLRRVFLYHSDQAERSRDPARRLERLIRSVFPDLELHRREGTFAPRDVRQHLETWRGEAPEDTWVVSLTEGLDLAGWGTAAWLGQDRCRVVYRSAGRDWLELTRSPEGDLETAPLTGIRREETDEVPLANLVRAQCLDAAAETEPRFEPASLPGAALLPLTEAAITHDWQWAEAFKAAGLEPGAAGEDTLFGRYLATLLAALGLPHIARNARGGTAHPGQLWVHRGGRLLVLDARLATADDGSATEAAGVFEQVESLARTLRPFAGLSVEGWLVRPCVRAAPQDHAAAQARGLGILDQLACLDLPARLAAFFGVPLTDDVVEVERRLRQHLTETGRTRLFGAESSVLRQPGSGSADPAWANTDAWLERVMRERGQNWLLWTHRSQGLLRAPVDGRPNAGPEWQQLLAAIARLDPGQVRSVVQNGSVFLEFPNQPDVRRWLAEWLQPFLNKPLSFGAAQARFAARARVEAEAQQVAGPPVAAPTAVRPAAKPGPVRNPPKSPPPPRSGPRERPPRNALADLDQALDAALGGN